MVGLFLRAFVWVVGLLVGCLICVGFVMTVDWLVLQVVNSVG